MYNIIYNIVIRKLYLFRKSSPFLIHFLAFFFVLFLDAQLAALLDWYIMAFFCLQRKKGEDMISKQIQARPFNLPELAKGR